MCFMNRRHNKRRIYKRMGHQFTYCPFGGSIEGLQKFYSKVAEALLRLDEQLGQAGIDHGTKDTQAQATGSHQ